MPLTLAGHRVPVIGRARLYVCGITPYDTTHLGHAATFVWTDVVARLLRRVGIRVDVCRNITDVDDDMLEQARRQGVPWRSLATKQTYRFEEDMRLLGIGHPEFEPQSHNYVEEVVALAGALIDTGHAYIADGAVWFRGGPVPRRAGLDDSRALELLREGIQPIATDQREPFDVPVWQPSQEDEPSWPSPWGDGRPGWHAECAAMALATLGPGLDIHAGGADLAFPHHAYESAQAEAATGVVPFARAWMHVGTVRLDGVKMAKSKGNLVFVHDLLEAWPPAAIRLLILTRPWASPWDYRVEDLDDAARRYERIAGLASRPHVDDVAERAAVDAMLNDLDVAGALNIAEEVGGSPLNTVGKILGVLP